MFKTILYEDHIEYIQDPRQGFYSCCTIELKGILAFFEIYKKIPRSLDCHQHFIWYKTPDQWNQDIRAQFFLDPDGEDDYVNFLDPISVSTLYDKEPKDPQYIDYSKIRYQEINPIIKRFFTPSQEILDIETAITYKYGIDTANTCALFLRGNDKKVEIEIPKYESYIELARQIYQENPDIKFLVQSDETDFLYAMSREFPKNHLILYEEIRAIPKTDHTTVDKVYRHLNHKMSKNFLAIMQIMSKCKYVVCNTGNCSLWIALFRKTHDGIIQLNAPTNS
jgi:hypothetical protein